MEMGHIKEVCVMKKAMKCMAGILALTLAFAQVAPVSAFAEETTATTATQPAQAAV